MALLASRQYDPAGVATVATTGASVMAIFDTTNLRNVFTVPPNGAVLARMRACTHGATTFPQTLLGILEGATVRGRMVPMGSLSGTGLATTRVALENLVVISGLTAGASLTWDMAYGTETGVASSAYKWGGPNDNSGNDAHGAAIFEIYDAPNLLGAVVYDPATASSAATTSLLAMTAISGTNVRVTFTSATTRVLWRVRCCFSGATTYPQILLGVLDGATVRGRAMPVTGIPGTAATTTNVPMEASGVVTGLTAGTSYTWDAAYAVQTVLALTAIRWGGPNNTVANDAWGGVSFECWAI